MAMEMVRAANVKRGDRMIWSESVPTPSQRPVQSASRENDTGLMFIWTGASLVVLPADDLVEVDRQEVES